MQIKFNNINLVLYLYLTFLIRFHLNSRVFLNNLNAISEKWPLTPKNIITFWFKGTGSIVNADWAQLFRLTTTNENFG